MDINSLFCAALGIASPWFVKSTHFKTIIYLVTGGLDFNTLNPNYLPT